MSLYSSTDLLARVKRLLNRPSTDEALSDTDLYAALTDAQMEATLYLAARVPSAMMVAPTQLDSADGGLTYAFPDDTDGDAIIALGHYVLYPSEEAIPDSPLIEGEDFQAESSRIRIPNNNTRTFDSGGPWGQWVEPPNVLSAAAEPSFPKPLRGLLVYGACELASLRLKMDPTYFRARFERELARAATTLRTRSGQAGYPRGRDRSWMAWEVL